MSEYQYYEFVAVDRALDAGELAAVRELSTRADITPTSFVNEYHWGSFRGDPRELVERYYDAFLHLANWGTREVMVRFPRTLLDLSVAQLYCVGDRASAWSSGQHVVIGVVAEDEEPDFDWDGQGALGSILPVRAEILAGDLRALYLCWLLEVQEGALDGDAVEPPVPDGLASLTGSQTALAAFLRIDVDLLAVAAAGSASAEAARSVDVEGWVAGLPAQERDALLVAFLRGDDSHLRTITVRRMTPQATARTAGRTVDELLDAAASRRDGRERAEREEQERAAVERARLAAEARRRRLDGLAAEGGRAWDRVVMRIAEKKPTAYDVAVELLVDLREVTDKAEFVRRVDELRTEHQRKPALMERLAAAGL